MTQTLVAFIREQYRTNEPIPLHVPTLGQAESDAVRRCIESTFVSSVGPEVTQFESQIAAYTASPAAVATTTGTAALHLALRLAGVEAGDYVITQSLTFIATCNAISYQGAEPIFIDIDRARLGLSPQALTEWLEQYAVVEGELCREKKSRRIIRACVPMHTFGHPCDMDRLTEICRVWKLALVEDAAESLGSFYKQRHTGTFGGYGVLSFNGNKIITTGGGGMVLCDAAKAKRAKHLSTTAKLPHAYEYRHDELGYNYRLPNLNAALGCAQMRQLESFIVAKRALAKKYQEFFVVSAWKFVSEPEECRSNYWLNAVLCEDFTARNQLLHETHQQGIMTRPVWQPMHQSPLYQHCLRGSLNHTEWAAERLVNLPSSVPPQEKA